MKVFLVLWIGLISVNAIGQIDKSAQEQYVRDQEQIKRAALMRTIDSAVVLMNDAKYNLAEERFLYVLNTIKGVPSDLTFYFGKNSFYLKKYKQSIDWINKYIQLRGTTGQFSAEATDLLKKAEEQLLLERTASASKAEEVLVQDFDIDCGPTGKVICPVCKGTTVIIRRGAFGNEYRTCGYCDKHGMLTCDEYNLLLRGELKPREN